MAVGIESLGTTIGHKMTADDIEPVNWAQGEYADNLSAYSQYATALAAVGQYRRTVHQWWADGWDLLPTPTVAAPPLPIGALYDADDGIDPDNPMAPSIRAGRFVAFTPQSNASGQPAINLPLHGNDAGLRLGVQLVAAYGREDLPIRVASQLEAAAPWAHRRPM